MDFPPTSLLLCKENEANFDQQEEIDEFSSIGIDDDTEYIKMLLDREITSTYSLQIQQLSQTCGDDNWIQRARLDGINYILTKMEILGFSCQTAYLSVTYLDRFLSRRSIDREKWWAIRLLSIACLSLGAKMEECRVPPLSDFCLDDECCNFESFVIQRMELLVLNTLEWKMGAITPFAFIRFFIDKFRSRNSTPINGLSRIVQLILGSMKDMKIMCHKASMIAATATLVVLDQRLLTKDALQLKIASLCSTCALKIEDVICCYYQFKELELQRVNYLEESIVKSPNLSLIQLTRTDAGISVNSNTKRKRLIFDHLDDDISDKKQKHL